MNAITEKVTSSRQGSIKNIIKEHTERLAVFEHLQAGHNYTERESLKIMKNPSYFNPKDAYKLSNTWKITLRIIDVVSNNKLLE